MPELPSRKASRTAFQRFASAWLVLFALLPTPAMPQTVLPPEIRAELAVLRDEDPVSMDSASRLCEIGATTPQQNLQQLCYKTACAGFAFLNATNQYEEALANVITKSFAEAFLEKCHRCRGIGMTMVSCPDCGGRKCPSCKETGTVRVRCPDCNGTASIFSHDLALAAYRRGLAALVKDPEPALPAPPASPRRLTDDQFFARHSLDLVAYAVFTNRQSTSIQKAEAFRQISARAYVPRGFSSAILLYRYPSGVSFVVSDVSEAKEVFHVSLRRQGDTGIKQLIIPKSESEVALWKKGRSVTSRDWVFAANAYSPLVPSSPGLFSTSGSVFYRSIAEFRQLHPEQGE